MRPPAYFPFRRAARVDGRLADPRRNRRDRVESANANRPAQRLPPAPKELHSPLFHFAKLADFELLLANLVEVPVHFAVAPMKQLVQLLIEHLKAHPHTPRVSTGCDAQWPTSSLQPRIVAAAPEGFVPFTIHGDAFEDAGATAAEEIGLALAAGIDFLAAMQDRGVDLSRAAAAIEFSFAIGANYFFQIAKLRAFRMVWAARCG